MRYEWCEAGRHAILAFDGELDMSVAPAVGAALDAAGRSALIDFGGVRYIDSSIIGKLALFARRVTPEKPVICGIAEHILRVLNIVRFGEYFRLTSDVRPSGPNCGFCRATPKGNDPGQTRPVPRAPEA